MANSLPGQLRAPVENAKKGLWITGRNILFWIRRRLLMMILLLIVVVVVILQNPAFVPTPFGCIPGCPSLGDQFEGTGKGKCATMGRPNG